MPDNVLCASCDTPNSPTEKICYRCGHSLLGGGNDYFLHNYPKRRLVIWDLDGTLCDTRWRDGYAKRQQWDQFHAGIAQDKPFEHMLFLLRSLMNNGAHPLIITARPATYCEETSAWLHTVAMIFSYTLLMRAPGDLRRASVIKGELLDRYLELRPDDEVLFALEDHAPVVAMWRSRGIPCFHVTDARG